ncbi:hypothetical protein [Mobiluncus curtisii]|nr:hypothetical protein [Mobiluncus curtisii]
MLGVRVKIVCDTLTGWLNSTKRQIQEFGGLETGIPDFTEC